MIKKRFSFFIGNILGQKKIIIFFFFNLVIQVYLVHYLEIYKIVIFSLL